MNMELYYTQLIEQIREAAMRRPQETVEAVIVHHSWIDKYPSGRFLQAKKFSDWFGLEKDIFPPPEKFSEEQLEFLADLLAALFHHYHHELGISKYEDTTVRYNLAVATLDSESSYVADSENPIYFCERDENKCPFKYDCYCAFSKREHPCSFGRPLKSTH